MSWLTDTAALYGRVLRRGAELTARNPAMILGVVATLAVQLLAGPLIGGLGILGGFVWTLLVTACVSCWLSLAGQVIRSGRVRLEDVPAGFGAYLGDLLTVGFILWGLRLIATFVLAPFPFLAIVVALATAVFFNAVPELIYLGRTAAPDLLPASYRFIAENWIEWFPLNVALVAGLLAMAVLVPPGPLGVLTTVTTAATLAFVLVARGLLFLELTTSGRRAREFKRRASS